MEKQYLIDALESGLSLNQIAKNANKALSTVCYWRNKHGLRATLKSFKDAPLKDYGGNRRCPKCTLTKPIDQFYSRRGKEGSGIYCKDCTSIQSLERQ
jgi:hypothetical protein